MKKICGLRFEDTPTKDSTVIDLGACCGDFSKQIVADYGCKVIAYEPSHANLSKLKKVKGIEVVPCAVGLAAGKVKFYDYGKFSGSTLKRKNFKEAKPKHATPYKLKSAYNVKQVAFAEVVKDGADLVKMDIEGAEWEILGGEEAEVLRKCKQITAEFHYARFQGFDYGHAFAVKTALRLRNIGFKVTTYEGMNVLARRNNA